MAISILVFLTLFGLPVKRTTTCDFYKIKHSIFKFYFFPKKVNYSKCYFFQYYHLDYMLKFDREIIIENQTRYF